MMRGSLYALVALSLSLLGCSPPSAPSAEEGGTRGRFLRTSGIVVDHTTVALFDQIPPEYLAAASALRMHFFDRSVGDNISNALNCFPYPSYEAAPSRCKRNLAEVGETFRPSLAYDRSRWAYSFSGGSYWHEKLADFIAVTTAEAASYDVFNLQLSYLEVSEQDDIASPTTGYFVDQPNRPDVHDLVAHEARLPGKVFIYSTSSLSRGIGTQVSERFNSDLRAWARANDKILFDIADIESHAPDGRPCYDNRDGVYYSNGNAWENHPDDGLDLAAICPEYTSEADGGHLGNQATGGIRLAKAFWVVMAQIAGWTPGGGPAANQAPVVNAGSDASAQLPSATLRLAGAASDDGRPTGTLTTTWSVSSAPAGGSAVFSNAGLLDATVTFGAAGTYVLRLAASDGALTSHDELTVTVHLAGSGGGTLTPSAHWPFESGSVADVISGCADCQNRGATPLSAGKVGGAFDLDGVSSYLDLAAQSRLEGRSAFTFVAWIKPAFGTTASRRHHLLADGDAIQLFYLDATRGWRGAVRTPTGTYRVDATGASWTAETWHQVALVFSSSGLSIYFDGVRRATRASSGAAVTHNLHVSLGRSGAGGDYFDGAVDEVKIFDRALTDAEVASLFTP
ncbi:MAG: hypothetical protein IT371_03275 [Deltaproteobacteria bacterium]|nr:hypothetical protein [Deltaproteobacteria bacterium]